MGGQLFNTLGIIKATEAKAEGNKTLSLDQ